MIDFNRAIELIRRNGGFKPNRRDTSYYRTYTMEDGRPMQARVSNHGTWLWTWYDKDYDPSYAINTCVVYSENGEDKSDVSVDMEIKDEEGNVVGERKSFEVTQYVYNCQILDDNDAALINQAVQNIWQNKGFKDPLVNTHKHAKVMILRPNETPEIITETKYTNMNKKQIRLTESDLKQIVKDSVGKILSEAYGTMPKDDIKRAANLDAASQSRFDERGEEIEDIKNDEFSRKLQNLQRHLTKCWWMANSLETHMKHNEFLGKASERYVNYVMDNISNASDGLDRIISIAKMKIGQ